ncbi:unnamed protein product [Rhizoctonia solani]|uniref:RBR-type E3 ubiquitin transferase n=2 Tax=Rhizoctonia solani TaxID=456999 RepID=A0A8H3ABZ9_9AGAM|nr:unnamed protein product [Rhizoctonia solani]CAE6516190.1 unnamed protein product [Rhizoctonia solani]
MQSAPSASFSGYPQTVPALGFARVGSGSISSRQQTAPGGLKASNDSRSYGREPSYRVPTTQPTVPSSTRSPHATFTTASRNGLHTSPRSTREDPGSSWALSSSEAGAPANSFSKVSTNAERRPEPAAPFGANPYGSPPNTQTRMPNTQMAAANAARNLYAHRPSPVVPPGSVVHDNAVRGVVHPSVTLSPPISTIPYRRSPSPLHQFETAASKTMYPVQEFNRRNAGPPEPHQGMAIDTSDYYSRHDGRTAAVPSQPSVLPANPLVSIQVAPTLSNNVETQMCVVCFEQGAHVRFAARSPTIMCQHGATVCVSCFEQHILIAIHKSRTVDIRCPHEGCGKMLEYQDIYCSVRDWGMLAYYEQLLIRREMGSTEQFVWCKNPICTSGQVHKPGPSQPIVTCNTCRQRSCYIHDRPWHEGLSCAEFDIKLRKYEEQDLATRTYLVKNTKSCPKCKRKIERNGGCDHMTCQLPGGCGHEFCWECLADGSDHKSNCTHHVPFRGRRRARTIRHP